MRSILLGRRRSWIGWPFIARAHLWSLIVVLLAMISGLVREQPWLWDTAVFVLLMGSVWAACECDRWRYGWALVWGITVGMAPWGAALVHALGEISQRSPDQPSCGLGIAAAMFVLPIIGLIAGILVVTAVAITRGLSNWVRRRLYGGDDETHRSQ